MTEDRVDCLETEMKETKSRLEKLEAGELPPKMVEAVQKMQAAEIAENQTAGGAEIDKNAIEKMMEEKVREQREETEDRTRRSKNLVIFGLEEPSTEDKEERKQDEATIVQKLMKEIDCSDSQHPQDVRRLGIFTKEKGKKPRPLRLSFTNQHSRDEVLQAFRKAKKDAREQGEEGTPRLTNKASARKDLTPSERKEEERLYKELKEKQEQAKQSGDDTAKWVRRNGKVVNIGRTPRPSREEAEN
jgi:hypothetical protein